MPSPQPPKAPGRQRRRFSLRSDPAWWAWAIVAVMALVPIASIFLQIGHPAAGAGFITFSFSAHG